MFFRSKYFNFCNIDEFIFFFYILLIPPVLLFVGFISGEVRFDKNFSLLSFSVFYMLVISLNSLINVMLFLMSWLRCLVWLALSYTSLKYFLWATFESFGCSFCKCCWFYLQTPTYQGIVTSFLVSFEIYFFLFISATIFTAFNNSLWIATTHHIFWEILILNHQCLCQDFLCFIYWQKTMPPPHSLRHTFYFFHPI